MFYKLSSVFLCLSFGCVFICLYTGAYSLFCRKDPIRVRVRALVVCSVGFDISLNVLTFGSVGKLLLIDSDKIICVCVCFVVCLFRFLL